MNLSIAVQHHPRRSQLLGAFAELEHELVTDPEPNGVPSAFRTYLECLRRTPAGATHRLILQDDAIPCPSFLELARERVTARPDDLIAFFVPGRSSLRDLLETAHRQGERWVPLPKLNWCPTVALCWPAELIPEFLPYGEAIVENRARRGMATMADDPYVGEWFKARRRGQRHRREPESLVWATVPCLVQHPDTTPSLYRPDLKCKGTNRSRMAALYVDDIAAMA